MKDDCYSKEKQSFFGRGKKEKEKEKTHFSLILEYVLYICTCTYNTYSVQGEERKLYSHRKKAWLRNVLYSYHYTTLLMHSVCQQWRS